MKLPLSWIALFTDIDTLSRDQSPKSIAHTYSVHVAEVEGIEKIGYDKVVVGKVTRCEKHPDSKKLSIVDVYVGSETVTILTGAPNISGATYVAVALVGAVLHGDFTIGERMMAGMMSRGMICSIDELGLASERAEGIMILEEYWNTDSLESHIGKSFYELTLPFPSLGGRSSFPLGDVIFEIDNKSITNRPDLFGVRGNAREFHALFETDLFPEVHIEQPKDIPALHAEVQTEKCLTYTLMQYENITVGTSPLGISLMMERAGLAPKLDIVDITNAIMTEYGQPMHAFDADLIDGHIMVRMARPGEKILALNNVEYELTDQDMVIADNTKILAIAGIIGGISSAIHSDSRRVLFEAACFDSTSVRLTAQRLGIRTDASTRFEKSLDPALPHVALPRVADYLDFLGKNIQPSGFFSHTAPRDSITLEITYDFLDWKIGVKIPHATIQNILTRLGFLISGVYEDRMLLEVPSWRATKDIKIREDIAEEVARIYGYEKIQEKSLEGVLSITHEEPILLLQGKVLTHFSMHAWDEVYNYSFSNIGLDSKVGYEDEKNAIEIKNAFNVEYTHMRRSLAPRLLMNLEANIKYQKSLSFFEIGKVFSKEGEEFTEKKVLAGVTSQKSLAEIRQNIESFLATVTPGTLVEVHQDSALAFLHPNITGRYTVDGDTVAYFGRIHPETAGDFSLPTDIYYFEILLETLLPHVQESESVFHEISKYPSIPRELNFILPERMPIGSVTRTIDAVHPWIRDISVSSIFQDDEKIGKEKKSVTFHFFLQNQEATITDEAAGEVQNMIIEAMKKDGYELRGV